MTDSVVTANRLFASAGVMSQGGGLYGADPFSGQPFPVTITRTVIEGNKPDQCVGCCLFAGTLRERRDSNPRPPT